ncbi:hypothetical protein BGX38DRAFT_60557 [Terfezia claveryi]|nr:hypothetical protein BGX38DRAFT_60557 [Terfezia claveryi]
MARRRNNNRTSRDVTSELVAPTISVRSPGTAYPSRVSNSLDTPSAASPESSLYAHRNGEPSALSSSARLGHRQQTFAARSGSSIHPKSPQTPLSSSKPVCIGSFRSRKATCRMDIPSLLDTSPDSDPKGPRSLEWVVGPRQLKRIWGSRLQDYGDTGHSESDGGVKTAGGSSGCLSSAPKSTEYCKVPLCSMGGNHGGREIEFESDRQLGYSTMARQAHGRIDQEVEEPEAGTEILHVQPHGQGDPAEGLTDIHEQPAPRSHSTNDSDGLAPPGQLPGKFDKFPITSLSTSMTLNSQGTERQEPTRPINKQNLLSVQLLKMTTQELTEWMAKKERETRNRLRREGRDKGFRNEQALLEYVNDRIEEPSKGDWPGLNKCPIEHAKINEKKRANRREMEQERLAKHR